MITRLDLLRDRNKNGLIKAVPKKLCCVSKACPLLDVSVCFWHWSLPSGQPLLCCSVVAALSNMQLIQYQSKRGDSYMLKHYRDGSITIKFPQFFELIIKSDPELMVTAERRLHAVEMHSSSNAGASEGLDSCDSDVLQCPHVKVKLHLTETLKH